MIFCRILLVFLALLAQLYSTEPVILPLDEDQNWRALFPTSELVTLRPGPDDQLDSVKLHFRQNTLFKLQYDKDAAAAGRILPPTTIWEAIRIWVAIGQGRKLSIEEWKLVTPIEYHTKVGKQIGPVDEDEGYYVGEWPRPAGSATFSFPTDLYIAGILEHGGYIMPICVIGARKPDGIHTNYLFDHLDLNGIAHFGVKPTLLSVGHSWLLTQYGGVEVGPWVPEKIQPLGVFNLTHQDGAILTDLWEEPNLDRLLPKLSHPDHTETQSGEMISEASGK